MKANKQAKTNDSIKDLPLHLFLWKSSWEVQPTAILTYPLLKLKRDSMLSMEVLRDLAFKKDSYSLEDVVSSLDLHFPEVTPPCCLPLSDDGISLQTKSKAATKDKTQLTYVQFYP